MGNGVPNKKDNYQSRLLIFNLQYIPYKEQILPWEVTATESCIWSCIGIVLDTLDIGRVICTGLKIVSLVQTLDLSSKQLCCTLK